MKKSPKIEYDLKKKTPFELHHQFVDIIEQDHSPPRKINKQVRISKDNKFSDSEDRKKILKSLSKKRAQINRTTINASPTYEQNSTVGTVRDYVKNLKQQHGFSQNLSALGRGTNLPSIAQGSSNLSIQGNRRFESLD